MDRGAPSGVVETILMDIEETVDIDKAGASNSLQDNRVEPPAVAEPIDLDKLAPPRVAETTLEKTEKVEGKKEAPAKELTWNTRTEPPALKEYIDLYSTLRLADYDFEDVEDDLNAGVYVDLAPLANALDMIADLLPEDGSGSQPTYEVLETLRTYIVYIFDTFDYLQAGKGVMELVMNAATTAFNANVLSWDALAVLQVFHGIRARVAAQLLFASRAERAPRPIRVRDIAHEVYVI